MRKNLNTLVILMSQGKDKVTKNYEELLDLFGVEKITVIENISSAHKDVCLKKDWVVLGDDNCDNWFPDHDFYKIYWSSETDVIVAVLRRLRRWEKPIKGQHQEILD